MTSTIDRREFLIGSGAVAGLAAASNPLRAKATRVRVADLKVDYLESPLGLENLRPQLSWRLESPERNVRQSAYRIWVASAQSMLARGQGDLWDSGKVSSPRSFGVVYEGQALQSRQQCWWRVQVWDQAGVASEPSVIGGWEMGLLSPGDWEAQWLAVDDAIAKADRETRLEWIWGASTADAAPRKFRYHIQLPAPTKGGVLFTFGRMFEYVTGVWMDGTPLGGEIPVKNLRSERIAFGSLSAGEHCLAIELDQKNPFPEVFVGTKPELGVAVFARCDMEDGRQVRVASGPEWKTSLTRDAGWHQPQYDDKAWSVAVASPVERILIPEPAFHLRREFAVEGDIVAARLYATSLGCYEARLNGKRVGDALLTPEISQYGKRTLYRVYDVKRLLQLGPNVLGLTVGDGWYASHPARYRWGPPPRQVIAQLELTFSDGSRQIVATGPDWSISRSPIVQSELCVGEVYDARLEQAGWDIAGFNDSRWQRAELTPRPSCSLVAHASPPIRAMQKLKPQAITQPAPGSYVFDFGQNFAGWCRLHVRGAAGSRIDLHFAEELQSSGEIDQFVLLGARASDTYILRGDPTGETFEPRFAYHGFRYVRVTGLTTAPSRESLEGIVIHSDLAFTGRLRIDDPLIEKVWRNAVWSQRSNFIGIPTDCPNRAERMGYMGDAGVFWDAAAFNMDVAAFTRRQMDNVRADQYANGAFTLWAPAVEDKPENPTAAAAWSDGSVILPWTSWRRYGDLGIIEQNWEAMNRYLQFILDRNPDSLWKKGHGPDFGDWLAIGNNQFYHPDKSPPTPIELITTAYWAHSADLLAQMADASGRKADAARLRAVRERVREAFISTFVQPDGRVGNGSQTSYILALKYGLVPDQLRSAAAAHLVTEIRGRGVALSTGILGTQYSLDVLADAGYPDVAYSLLLRRADPSWGFMIAHGATTMWEMWDGDLQHLHNEGSHNHEMFGAVCGFLFRRVAGIDALEPGFERIVIRPILDPRVQRGGGDYDSITGRISTDWAHSADGRLTLNVTIPANTTAQIQIPARRNSRIEEGGQDLSRHRDMQVVQRLDHEAVIAVGSGNYRFVVVG